MSDRELIISSATIVQPGDKVLLVLPPDAVMPDEAEGIKDRLVEWAPGVDWLLVAGANAVIHVPATGAVP